MTLRFQNESGKIYAVNSQNTSGDILKVASEIFRNHSKVTSIDSKRKSGQAAVKRFVKEHKCQEFACCFYDSNLAKDDSIEIYLK